MCGSLILFALASVRVHTFLLLHIPVWCYIVALLSDSQTTPLFHLISVWTLASGALKEEAADPQCVFHQRELPVIELAYEAMLIVAISRGSE